jgi:glycosyltransferase involved in cell wall biosynthesis
LCIDEQSEKIGAMRLDEAHENPAVSGEGPPRHLIQGNGRPILALVPQPFYQDRGTPITTRYFVSALSELGFRVDVLTFPLGSDLDVPGVTCIRSRNWLGVKAIPVGFSLRKMFFDLSLTWQFLRAVRSKDYCLIHAVEESCAISALFAPTGIPLLYDMQSDIPHQLSHNSFLGLDLLARFHTRLQRPLFKRRHVARCSAGLAESIKRRYPKAVVSEWQYPGRLSDPEPSRAIKIRDELNIRPQASIVLYTGTFESYQGLGKLIDAIAIVRARQPDTVFILVGLDNGRANKSTLEKLSKVDSDAYRLVPRIPRQDVRNYLAICDVAVSTREFGGNLPLKILDYIAAGCAIVATDIHAHRSVLDRSLAQLVGSAR